MLAAGIIPSCRTPSDPYKATLAELVWSSGTDITLDEVLTILDEHYNNVKALDTLNQELFQMRMADKETVSDWGVHLSQHLQILAVILSQPIPPRTCG